MKRLVAATLAGVLALAGRAPAGAAPPLPQRNLSVEARVVEQSLADTQAAGGGVVVRSGGGATVQGGVTLRAGTDTRDSDTVQRVLVLNGATASLRLSVLTPLPTLALAWHGQTTGLAEQTAWVDVARGLTVQPSWPGGAAPVRVVVAVESAPAGGATVERSRVTTEVALPLGAWITVADVADTAAAGSAAGGLSVATTSLRNTRSLQLRVTAP